MTSTKAASMEEPRYSRGDLVSGVVLAALGVFIVLNASQWNYTSPDGPGPGFFPLWYGIAMIVFSLLLVGGNLLRRHHAAPSQPLNRTAILRALGAWAAFTLSVALLHVLGFAVSFALLTLFLVKVLYRRPLRVALLVAVCSAVGFYLVFSLALGVDLPTGILGF